MSRHDQILRASSNEGLSLDEMRSRLPAIFADHPHESRSKRYVHVSTTELIETMGQAGFKPFEARVSRSRDAERQAFAKHMIRFRSSSIPTEKKLGDVSFEVVLKNAHDGTAAYDFMAGLFRLVCLNGMVVSDGNIASVHVRHAGDKAKILDQVVEGAVTVLQAAPIAMEAPRKWSGIELNHDEQLAFANSAHVIRFGDAEGKTETPIAPKQLLIPRRPGDIGNDLWKTFQRVQENAVRGGLSAIAGSRRATTREVRGIDADVKLNKALWMLADSMAKLKS